MSDLNEVFFQECDDLLEAMSTGINELEGGNGDEETVNSLFRAVHSIKGGAGAFGLDRLVAFAHAMENVLDDIRSGRLNADTNVIALLFASGDHLSDLVEAARDSIDLPAEQGASILSDLQMVCTTTDETSSATSDPLEDNADLPEFEPLSLSVGGDLPSLDQMSVAANAKPLKLAFKPTLQLYENGSDPTLLFRHLEELGTLTVAAETTQLRPLSDAPWCTPTLSWELFLEPKDDVDEAVVRDVFEFVDGLCELNIVAVDQNPAEPSEGFENAISSALPNAIEPKDPPKSLDENRKGAVAPSSQRKVSRQSTIRVDLDRVDRLINLVGELVIAEAMLRQSMDELAVSSSNGVDEAMGQLKQLSGAIQESVMAIRAQPVRNLFQRMSRIVREASKEAGKSARLATIGDATEVDKTVIERLVEPLTHMVRNAVDHGLETPDERRTAGKEECGVVTLEAAHRSGRVIISLSDDGAGINRARVREIAEQKGLIKPEDDLSETDIDNLLFRPGFSTASGVSKLSGRGVGMDVVRNEIQALGGRVSVHSTPGAGTTVTISLPLTLAVLEGMVVHVAEESLIVPTLPLREMLQPGQAKIHTLCDGDRVLALDRELIPIVDLGAALGYRKEPSAVENQSLLLVEEESGRRSAIAVDKIAEQREVVIKGLEQNYQNVPGIAAATILGDGNIALIVDTDQMIAIPGQSELPSTPTGANTLGDAHHA